MLKYICEFIKNSKIEVFLFLTGSAFFFIKETNFIFLDSFEKDRLISFFSIIAGIYVTVLTLIGTTIISITKELLMRDLDKKIINIISLGIIETLVTIVLLVKKDNITIFYNSFLILMLIITFISFIKFIIILILMFKANMNAMVKEIDEKEKNEIEILAILDSINKNLEKIKKLNEKNKSNNYRIKNIKSKRT